MEGPADAALVSYLEENRGDSAYLVAVNGSMQAAPLILATGGDPVMAMGGFNGSDPAPTAAQLQSLVANGDLRFVLLGGRGGPGVGSGDARTQWVQANCSPVDPAAYGGQTTISGGQQLYDCAGLATAAATPTDGTPSP
jgi:hypothetical protein